VVSKAYHIALRHSVGPDSSNPNGRVSALGVRDERGRGTRASVLERGPERRRGARAPAGTARRSCRRGTRARAPARRRSDVAHASDHVRSCKRLVARSSAVVASRASPRSPRSSSQAPSSRSEW